MRMPKFLSHLALLLAAAAGPAWAGGGTAEPPNPDYSIGTGVGRYEGIFSNKSGGGGTAEPRDPDYSIGTGTSGYVGIFTGSPGQGGGEGGKAETRATDRD